MKIPLNSAKLRIDVPSSPSCHFKLLPDREKEIIEFERDLGFDRE